MADVTEVIHKISYEVNHDALQSATVAIQNQVKELNTLAKTIEQYAKQLDKMSAGETKQLDDLLVKLDSVHKEIMNKSAKVQGAISEAVKGVAEGFGIQPELKDAISKYIGGVRKQYQDLSKAGADYKKATIGFHRDAAGAAAKSAGKTGSALSKLGKSLTSTTGLLDIGVSLLIMFGEELANADNRIGIFTGSVEALNKINQDAAGEVAKVSTELEVMKELFFDAGTTAEGKKKIVEELNTKYGDSIGQINSINQAEDFFINRSDAFVKALTKRAQIQGAYDLIAENQKKLLQAKSSDAEDNVGVLGQIQAGATSFFKNPLDAIASAGNPLGFYGKIDLYEDYDKSIKEQNEKILKDAAEKNEKQKDFLTEFIKTTTLELNQINNDNKFDVTTPKTPRYQAPVKKVAPPQKVDVKLEPVFDTKDAENAAKDIANVTAQQLRDALEEKIQEINDEEQNLLLGLEKGYQDGLISYEAYEAEKTRITQEAVLKRLQAEIDANTKITEIQDLDVQQKKQAERAKTKAELDKSKTENEQKKEKDKNKNDEGDDKKTKKISDEERERIKETIQEYQNLAQAAVDAYNTIAEAQIKTLDEEIKVREKRVEKARKLAERGNTEVLRLEEERLVAAQRKRDQIAKRQNTVNAALALSNSLVAVTGAIANAVKGDPYSLAVRVAAAIAAVIGALGSGYAFVKSFDADSVGAFADGVVGYKGKGGPRDDSNLVRISNGESVITAEGTQKNRALLEAINNGAALHMIDPSTPLMLPTLKQPNSVGSTHAYASTKELKGLEQKLDQVVGAIESNRLRQNIFFNEQGVGVLTERAVNKNRKRWKA